jgi:hypothetical protein
MPTFMITPPADHGGADMDAILAAETPRRAVEALHCHIEGTFTQFKQAPSGENAWLCREFPDVDDDKNCESIGGAKIVPWDRFAFTYWQPSV